MSTKINKLTKFTKATKPVSSEKAPGNGSADTNASKSPNCAPPVYLATRTVELVFRSSVESRDSSNYPKRLESPNSEVLTAQDPFQVPSVGDDTNNQVSQEPHHDTTDDHHPEPPQETGYKLEISILSQNVYPKKFLSVNTAVLSPNFAAQPSSGQGSNPVVILDLNNPRDLGYSNLGIEIQKVLAEIQVNIEDLEAVEATGSSERLPVIRETLRKALSNTSQGSVLFTWDKQGDTSAGYREVFLRNSFSPTTQVLVLRRNTSFSINYHRNPDKGDDRPNIIWSISGLEDKGSPATVKFVYTLYPSGQCDINTACTIIEANDSTEQCAPDSTNWIDQKVLTARYTLPQSKNITEEDLLQGIPSNPHLTDETGKEPVPLSLPVGLRFSESVCWIVVALQACCATPCTILSLCEVATPGMGACNLFLSTLVTVMILAETLLLAGPWLRDHIPMRHYKSWHSLAAKIVAFGLILIPQICSAANWEGGGAAIAVLSVGLADAFVCGICALYSGMNYILSSYASYGDYLQLGANLHAESYFSTFYADSATPRFSKAEEACLEHYRRQHIVETFHFYNTEKNEKFWNEMAILHRIPYALSAGLDVYPDALSRKCLRKDMTRAEAFQHVVTRKRKLLKLLEFPIVETEDEIKRRFALIREPDTKVVLVIEKPSN